MKEQANGAGQGGCIQLARLPVSHENTSREKKENVRYHRTRGIGHAIQRLVWKRKEEPRRKRQEYVVIAAYCGRRSHRY